MTSQCFTIERIDVTSTGSFDDAVTTFEKSVPPADVALFTRLVESRASKSEIAAAVQRTQGDLQLMVFAKISQGALTSLLGTPKKLIVYLIGNPLIANRMFERHRGAGLYAPLRVCLYEDATGAAHFVYDQPSSLLGPFEDAPKACRACRVFNRGPAGRNTRS
jgi:uncharacterized protein (DUF302 family)